MFVSCDRRLIRRSVPFRDPTNSLRAWSPDVILYGVSKGQVGDFAVSSSDSRASRHGRWFRTKPSSPPNAALLAKMSTGPRGYYRAARFHKPILLDSYLPSV